jgi:phosphoadenosine phosphosulfate reductase
MGNNKDELEAMPEYKKLYIHAFDRFLQRRPDLVGKNGWNDGESMYQWWVSGVAANRDLEDQASLFAGDSE